MDGWMGGADSKTTTTTTPRQPIKSCSARSLGDEQSGWSGHSRRTRSLAPSIQLAEGSLVAKSRAGSQVRSSVRRDGPSLVLGGMLPFRSVPVKLGRYFHGTGRSGACSSPCGLGTAHGWRLVRSNATGYWLDRAIPSQSQSQRSHQPEHQSPPPPPGQF